MLKVQFSSTTLVQPLKSIATVPVKSLKTTFLIVIPFTPPLVVIAGPEPLLVILYPLPSNVKVPVMFILLVPEPKSISAPNSKSPDL